MSRAGFIPNQQCSVASGDCFTKGRCLRKCNPPAAHGLDAVQLLMMAAQAQRKAAGEGSRIASKIDQMIRDVRGGVL